MKVSRRSWDTGHTEGMANVIVTVGILETAYI